MRWSWRADLLPGALDVLLEGSLVGVVYVALVPPGPGSSAPLSLIEFCVAAAVGLGWSRLRPGRVRRAAWLAALALAAGLAGWLADPGARAALATSADPFDALQVHTAGWLLGVSVIRGAVHENASEEIETSGRALVYAFPVLAAAWLIHLGSGGLFTGPALVGTAVCVGAGLLAIAHARLRDLGLLDSKTRGGRTWPKLATAVVLAVAAVAVPVALASGTSARDLLSAVAGPIGGPVGGVTGALVAPLNAALAWLASGLGHLLDAVPWLALPGIGGRPTRAAGPAAPPPGGPEATTPFGWLVVGVIVIAVVVIGLLFRRLVSSPPEPPPVLPPREERRRQLHLPRLSLHLPLPSVRLGLVPWRRPASAAEAYVALLQDLAERGDLGRRPAETPRGHAERGGALGLPRLPLGLIAADYELSIYGRASISELETARALGRRRHLRRVARDLRRHASET